MTTPERCRARAEEAERLATIVAYGRDKERLLDEAAEWRARAEAMEAEREAAAARPEPEPTVLDRLRGLFRRKD
jgi:hypothetical protein